ncbi:MAG TPA: hypothetical protein VGF97_17225 [Rhizomicrobium sp.]
MTTLLLTDAATVSAACGHADHWLGAPATPPTTAQPSRLVTIFDNLAEKYPDALFADDTGVPVQSPPAHSQRLQHLRPRTLASF